MKKIILSLALTITSSFALAKDVIVICNESLAADAAKVVEMFTGDIHSVGGTTVVVADNKSLQSDFLSKVLKMEQSKYDTTWAKKSFREGLAKPTMRTSDTEVVDFVKATAGAIGYISAPAAGVKTLGKF